MCPDFVFKGQECEHVSRCNMRHSWHHNMLAIQDLELIGDKFLLTCNGGFIKENYRDYPVKSLYGPLFLDINGKIFTRT